MFDIKGDSVWRAVVRPAAVGHPERDGGVRGQVRHHAQGRRLHEQRLHGKKPFLLAAKPSCLGELLRSL